MSSSMASTALMASLTPVVGLVASGQSQCAPVRAYSPSSSAPLNLECTLRRDLIGGLQASRSGFGWSGSHEWNVHTSDLIGALDSCQSTKSVGRRGVICMNLPAANGYSATGTLPKWSARAIKAFSMGELEARKLKYPTTGTEALIMGMLTEGTGEAAKFLRANGVTLFGVREETIKLLGKADMYFFSPEHPPLTEPAQKALDWAVEEHARLGGEGEITTEYMLLGIWGQKGSAGQQVLAMLGMDDAKMEELRKSLGKQAVPS